MWPIFKMTINFSQTTYICGHSQIKVMCFCLWKHWPLLEHWLCVFKPLNSWGSISFNSHYDNTNSTNVYKNEKNVCKLKVLYYYLEYSLGEYWIALHNNGIKMWSCVVEEEPLGFANGQI